MIQQIVIIIIIVSQPEQCYEQAFAFILGHHVAWIEKTLKFQYTNDSSFGHVWPRTKGVRLTNFGSPVYNRSPQ